MLTHGDVDVLEAVRSAITGLHDRGILYGDIFSPLHSDGIAAAAKRMTIFLHAAAIGQDELEAVVGPHDGLYLLVYSTDVDDMRRGFAIRHGMGHVAAGHVRDRAFLRARGDYMTHEERVADLFALVDLLPFHMFDELRKCRTSWGAMKQLTCRTIRRHTINWPEERVSDRADLRIALYREHRL